VVVALRIPVLLDCPEPFPPYHNKHVPLHRLLSIGLIETVDALPRVYAAVPRYSHRGRTLWFTGDMAAAERRAAACHPATSR
jgi:hypothetical protein